MERVETSGIPPMSNPDVKQSTASDANKTVASNDTIVPTPTTESESQSLKEQPQQEKSLQDVPSEPLADTTALVGDRAVENLATSAETTATVQPQSQVDSKIGAHPPSAVDQEPTHPPTVQHQGTSVASATLMSTSIQSEIVPPQPAPVIPAETEIVAQQLPAPALTPKPISSPHPHPQQQEAPVASTSVTPASSSFTTATPTPVAPATETATPTPAPPAPILASRTSAQPPAPSPQPAPSTVLEALHTTSATPESSNTASQAFRVPLHDAPQPMDLSPVFEDWETFFRSLPRFVEDLPEPHLCAYKSWLRSLLVRWHRGARMPEYLLVVSFFSIECQAE